VYKKLFTYNPTPRRQVFRSNQQWFYISNKFCSEVADFIDETFHFFKQRKKLIAYNTNKYYVLCDNDLEKIQCVNDILVFNFIQFVKEIIIFFAQYFHHLYSVSLFLFSLFLFFTLILFKLRVQESVVINVIHETQGLWLEKILQGKNFNVKFFPVCFLGITFV
jgi:hypothetical protein